MRETNFYSIYTHMALPLNSWMSSVVRGNSDFRHIKKCSHRLCNLKTDFQNMSCTLSMWTSHGTLTSHNIFVHFCRFPRPYSHSPTFPISGHNDNYAVESRDAPIIGRFGNNRYRPISTLVSADCHFCTVWTTHDWNKVYVCICVCHLLKHESGFLSR